MYVLFVKVFPNEEKLKSFVFNLQKKKIHTLLNGQ